MKVLVATHEGQGLRANDFCWAEDGEIVAFSIAECTREEVDGRCGCKRSLAGLRSHKATTTMQVVDLPMSAEDLAGVIRVSLKSGGWDALLDDNEMWEQARTQAERLLALVAAFPVGAIIERRGAVLQERT